MYIHYWFSSDLLVITLYRILILAEYVLDALAGWSFKKIRCLKCIKNQFKTKYSSSNVNSGLGSCMK